MRYKEVEKLKLYKYMSPTVGHKFLSEPYLRLTPRSCLNDPFEVMPSKTTRLRLRELSKNHGNTEESSERFSVELNGFLDLHGVISLSETYDNLLMWAHYAGEHKGIVVEFEIDESEPLSTFLLSDVPPSSDSFFDRVKYRKSRSFPHEFDENHISVVGKHYYLTKSDEWIYEKEHRYILPFTAANKVIVDTRNEAGREDLKYLGIEYECGEFVDISIYFESAVDFGKWSEVWKRSHSNGFIFLVRIDDRSISQLYIGANANNDEFNDLLENVYDGSPYISYRDIFDGSYHGVYKAKVNPDRFELDFALWGSESANKSMQPFADAPAD
ncbi:MAG: hypothetical protein ACI808_000252 [Paraglaciecola sp.]|jgi:hypothetical protein